jgi:uncharacterized protein YciI
VEGILPSSLQASSKRALVHFSFWPSGKHTVSICTHASAPSRGWSSEGEPLAPPLPVRSMTRPSSSGGAAWPGGVDTPWGADGPAAAASRVAEALPGFSWQLRRARVAQAARWIEDAVERGLIVDCRMAHFFARLTSKRSDFPADMTPAEGAAMGGHFAFLGELLASGTLVVAGPVMSRSGAFGIAVIEGESVDAVRELLARDPANAIGSYEVSPMGNVVVRPRP